MKRLIPWLLACGCADRPLEIPPGDLAASVDDLAVRDQAVATDLAAKPDLALACSQPPSVDDRMLTLLSGPLGGVGNLDGLGAAARFDSPSDVAWDGAGALYVSDQNGLRKVVVATGEVSTVYAGSVTAFTVDGSGTAYLRIGHAIERLDPDGGVSLLAGSEDSDSSTDGVGGDARFKSPVAIAWDGASSLLIADSGDQTIRGVEIVTGRATTLAGSPLQSGSTDGVGGDARFNHPNALVSDGGDLVYIVDGGNYTIRKLVRSTGAVSTLAGAAGAQSLADGSFAEARFHNPYSLALAGSDLFVSEWLDHSIRKLDLQSGVVSTWAGTASGNFADSGSIANLALSRPAGLVFDGAGHLLVADTGASLVRDLDILGGSYATLAGAPARATAELGGITLSGGRIFLNEGVLVEVEPTSGTRNYVSSTVSTPNWGEAASDGAGTLYLPRMGGIDQYRLSDQSTRVVAGSDDVRTGCDDGAGSGASFVVPAGVVLDGAGHLFVSDSAARNIRRVDLATGSVTTLAGTCGAAGSSDGIGAAASFRGLAGLAWDGAGTLYAADSGNFIIRKIDVASGAVTTLAGAANDNGSADGAALAARFSFPADVALDGQGHLLVADSFSHAVRQIDLCTHQVTTLIGSHSSVGVRLGPIASASLNRPTGLAVTPEGDLLIADSGENAVLLLRHP